MTMLAHHQYITSTSPRFDCTCSSLSQKRERCTAHFPSGTRVHALGSRCLFSYFVPDFYQLLALSFGRIEYTIRSSTSREFEFDCLCPVSVTNRCVAACVWTIAWKIFILLLLQQQQQPHKYYLAQFSSCSARTRRNCVRALRSKFVVPST